MASRPERLSLQRLVGRVQPDSAADPQPAGLDFYGGWWTAARARHQARADPEPLGIPQALQDAGGWQNREAASASPSTRLCVSTPWRRTGRGGSRTTSRGSSRRSDTVSASTRRGCGTSAAEAAPATTSCCRTARRSRRTALGVHRRRSASPQPLAALPGERQPRRRRGARPPSDGYMNRWFLDPSSAGPTPTTCSRYERLIGALDLIRAGDLDGSARSRSTSSA